MVDIPFRNGEVVAPNLRLEFADQCCECQMPLTVTMTLAGSPLIFFYKSNSGNVIANDANNFSACDFVPEHFARVWYDDALFPGIGQLLQPDCEIVLDLVNELCDYWRYEGYMPIGPTIDAEYPDVTCGGDLNQLAYVEITKQQMQTTVSFSPPTYGETRAAATAYTAGGVVQSIELTSGGGGYATVPTVHVEPVVGITISTTSGSGAVLTATLESYEDATGGLLWRILSVAVDDGGSGYDAADYAVVECEGPTECIVYANATLTLSISGGVVTGVTVDEGGGYYGEGPGEPDVDAVTVLIGSPIGSGATAEATVDSDPESATFGQVVAVTLTAGGAGYRDQARYVVEIGVPGVDLYQGEVTAIFQHRDVLVGDEQDADQPKDEEGSDDPSQCFINQLQPISPRLSYQKCPNDLLNKTYDMKVLAKYGQYWVPGTPNTMPPSSCIHYIPAGGTFVAITGPTVSLTG